MSVLLRAACCFLVVVTLTGYTTSSAVGQKVSTEDDPFSGFHSNLDHNQESSNAKDRPVVPEVVRYWIDESHESNQELFEKIENTELSNAGLDFADTPLDEIVAFLRDEYEIEIHLDIQSLDDFAIGPDEPITCNLRNIKLASALRLALKPLELTVTADNEVLLITTEDEALTKLVVAVYTIADLLGPRGDYDPIMDAILSTIHPQSWAINGGGEAEIRPIPSRGALVISQTTEVHEAIAGLLGTLRKLEAYELPHGDSNLISDGAHQDEEDHPSRGGYGGGGGFGFGGGSFSIPPNSDNE